MVLDSECEGEVESEAERAAGVANGSCVVGRLETLEMLSRGRRVGQRVGGIWAVGRTRRLRIIYQAQVMISFQEVRS